MDVGLQLHPLGPENGIDPRKNHGYLSLKRLPNTSPVGTEPSTPKTGDPQDRSLERWVVPPHQTITAWYTSDIKD